MSSHPQSVPTTRRTVETRHLPNPASLPLQLQRAHTVRTYYSDSSFEVKPFKQFYWICRFGSVCLVIFGKQGITLNPCRAWPQGPQWSFPNTQVIVLCTQRCSLIRCFSWKFMLSLYSSIKVSPIISTIVYIPQTKLSVFQRGASGLCRDLSSDPKYLQNYLFQYGSRSKNLTCRIPAAAPVDNPTNYSSYI